MNTIPDHVGREAVRLLNEQYRNVTYYEWPRDLDQTSVITVAKLLMNPPAPMTDPDEEAAKRVVAIVWGGIDWSSSKDVLARATEQMRKEFAARREAWEAGR